MAGAADEDRVRWRQAVEHGRCRAVHGRQVVHPEHFGVGQDQVIVRRILLDRVNAPGIREIGGLNGHRSGTGPDVPDDASGLEIKLSQRDGPDFRLRDQSALGPALREHVVRVAETAQPARLARLVGTARLPLQDHDIERRKIHALDVGQLALRDPLIGGADVFADIGAEVVDSLGQQLAGDA